MSVSGTRAATTPASRTPFPRQRVRTGSGLVVVGGTGAVYLTDPTEAIAAAGTGDLVRIRQGAYVGQHTWAALDARGRELAVVRVVHDRLAVGTLSHRTAALAWNLPLVGERSAGVHVTVPLGTGGRSRRDIVRHATSLPVQETVHDGFRLTTVARTVVDLARTAGFLTGVTAADHALHQGLTDLGELEEVLAPLAGTRGYRVARQVVKFADGRAESAGESLSRVRMHELGIPRPVPQQEFHLPGGRDYRGDFYWPDKRLIGEFDGKSKYGVDGLSAQEAADRLWQEKRREDALRAAGYAVVRWVWDDAWAGAPLARVLRDAGL